MNLKLALAFGLLGVAGSVDCEAQGAPVSDVVLASVVPAFVAEADQRHPSHFPVLSPIKTDHSLVIQSLRPAEATESFRLRALEDWNLGLPHSRASAQDNHRKRAVRNGFTRAFHQATAINLGAGSVKQESASNNDQPGRFGLMTKSKAGSELWLGAFKVESAHLLRLKLENVQLASTTRLWVKGDSRHWVGPFGAESVNANGVLYSPSVEGEIVTLMVEAPNSPRPSRFTVTAAVEMFELTALGAPIIKTQSEGDLSCLEEVSCHDDASFSFIDETKQAIGLIYFVEGGSSYICTGGLINDTDVDTVKNYFLTANHCISSQSSANSVDVVWDYFANSCGSSPPSQNSRPRSSGASLLATDSSADYTLLELNNRPGTRWFLGWSTAPDATSAGTLLHRVSHPAGKPQHLSQGTVDTDTGFFCQGVPRPRYLYTQLVLGGTQGGSSGSPLITNNGEIVGQQYGGCGEDYEEVCNYSNREVDGALANYWDEISPFLDPQSVVPEERAADLDITILNSDGGDYFAGDQTTLENQIKNLGDITSEDYDLTFYASINTNITPSDSPLGTVRRSGLAGGAVDSRNTDVTLPDDLAPGSYYVGAIIELEDANEDNNRAFDGTRITILPNVVENGFEISPGVAGTWGNPETLGQGMMIEVFPGSGLMFAAWFTFDLSPPDSPESALLGFAGHRWLTAVGAFAGSKATLNIQLTRDGLFNSSDSAVDQDNEYGRLDIEFFDCSRAEARFDIPAIAQSGTINLQRFTGDSVATCETVTEAFK